VIFQKSKNELFVILLLLKYLPIPAWHYWANLWFGTSSKTKHTQSKWCSCHKNKLCTIFQQHN